MNEHTRPPLRIPTPKLSFRLSRAALVLLLTTVILAVLIGFSTYRNITRSRDLIEEFLLDKGETIIRSLEAGNRTSMMHFHMGSGDPLDTLIQESSREDDIAFILIMNSEGRILMQTDIPSQFKLTPQEIEKITNGGLPVAHFNKERGIFTLSKSFQPEGHTQGMMMGGNRHRMMSGMFSNFGTRIITVGLVTKEFDAARKRDIQHALLMGGVLFLVGSAGLYMLFIYQEMRVARTTLADLKIYTDNVIESMPAGLVTLDVHDRVISCNTKAEEILGRSLGEVSGMKIEEAFPGCDVDCEAICSETLDHMTECTKADGKTVPVKISGSPLMNENGQQTGTVLIVKDMSIIKYMEQQLERSRQMAALGKMAAGIAHEIRNPLGTLRGFAHYFGAMPDATDESKDYAELMKSEVDRLNRTISGLLQFARPREPDFVTTTLDDLLSKAVALTEADFAKNNLDFHYQCNTNISITADPDQLLQVLMNLLQNSIAATSSGGEVSLQVAEDEQQVRITISDTGCGMTEEAQQKMFDPFFTTRKTGTGLGLAVSHQIIEQHNGSFEVESTPEKGTTITIVLPRSRGGYS
jgi:two-component system, NtrC family, sensor histidine kinase HydH